MRILLDECLPLDFRRSFEGLHEVHTAEWAGFKGKKNSELLKAAEANSYDVLLTVDQGIVSQRSILYNLSIVIIRSNTNRLDDLVCVLPKILGALAIIKPGQIVSVG